LDFEVLGFPKGVFIFPIGISSTVLIKRIRIVGITKGNFGPLAGIDTKIEITNFRVETIERGKKVFPSFV
jgi:hypothetical protein